MPHRLVDIRDPEESYSAGEFVRDAAREIDASNERGRIPLLVGGTMMYFRALTEGIADLPEADGKIRAAIDAEAETSGWPALHAQLAKVDAKAAARINPNDSQRIQRALEVYRVSGKSLSAWQASGTSSNREDRFLKIALLTERRSALHEKIGLRLRDMMENGFVEEVETLMARPRTDCQPPVDARRRLSAAMVIPGGAGRPREGNPEGAGGDAATGQEAVDLATQRATSDGSGTA